MGASAVEADPHGQTGTGCHGDLRSRRPSAEDGSATGKPTTSGGSTFPTRTDSRASLTESRQPERIGSERDPPDLAGSRA